MLWISKIFIKFEQLWEVPMIKNIRPAAVFIASDIDKGWNQ